MTTHIWDNRTTGAALRALRAAGYEEQKLEAGSIVRSPHGQEVFRSLKMAAKQNLVRYKDGIFVNAPQLKRA